MLADTHGRISAIAVLCLPALQVADIDFSTDSFPQCDVITMGMILHDWGPQKKKLLVQNQGKASTIAW